MDSDRLRQGQEVLEDSTYLGVSRAVFAFRLLACAMTSALTPTTGPGVALLVMVSILSGWGMFDSRFVRAYVRHPLLAGLDALVAVLLVSVEWPASLSILVLALTALLVGLLLTPWLGLPALILTLGSTVVLSSQVTDTLSAQWSGIALIGLPIFLVGMTSLGWTVRYAFVELKRSRDEAMAEEVRRREEEERGRLARGMHDSLGKTVHGISLAATALRTATANGRITDAADLAVQIEGATREAADQSRSLLRGLRRHQDDRPIAEQLGELARAKANDELAIRTQIDAVADLPQTLVTEVVFIVEEALHNIVEHSRAERADILLERTPDGLTLRIQDDGQGFCPSETARRERAGHFGLRGMRERAERSGGDLQVRSAAHQGTTVVGRWPTAALKERS